MSILAPLFLRGTQIVLGLIILSLSGNLLATQAIGSPPSVTVYNVFLSIWIIAIAAIGITAKVARPKKEKGAARAKRPVMALLDTISAVLTLAGAVTLTLLLPLSTPCACTSANTSCPVLVSNSLINGGTNDQGEVDLPTDRVSRCHQVRADSAFLWCVMVSFVVMAAAGWRTWRKERAQGWREMGGQGRDGVEMKE